MPRPSAIEDHVTTSREDIGLKEWRRFLVVRGEFKRGMMPMFSDIELLIELVERLAR